MNRWQMEKLKILNNFKIRAAKENDTSLILSFIKELADYEKLSADVVATEDALRESLFGNKPFAEVLLGFVDNEPASFAVFFHNFSTFLGKPGIYLEDLYVKPELRGRGIGKAMLTHLAKIAIERDCGRFEWSVLDWNEQAIRFYKSLGAVSMNEWTTFRVSGDALHKLATII